MIDIQDCLKIQNYELFEYIIEHDLHEPFNIVIDLEGERHILNDWSWNWNWQIMSEYIERLPKHLYDKILWKEPRTSWDK